MAWPSSPSSQVPPSVNPPSVPTTSSGTTTTIDTQEAEIIRKGVAAGNHFVNDFHLQMLNKYDEQRNQKQTPQAKPANPTDKFSVFREANKSVTAAANGGQETQQAQPATVAVAAAATRGAGHLNATPARPPTAFPPPASSVATIRTSSSTASSLTSAPILPSILNQERLSQMDPSTRQECLDLMRNMDRGFGWSGGFLERMREMSGAQSQHESMDVGTSPVVIVKQKQHVVDGEDEENIGQEFQAQQQEYDTEGQHDHLQQHDSDPDGADNSITLALPEDIEAAVKERIRAQHDYNAKAVRIEMELKELWWQYAGRI
ncbi:hypothetical protein BD289DRAFT_507819 [Coniella lustricola]|uniref:Uncharacterized protein n=1 Tax=Coniella lustricola TaxID=2025994 RepID=A0A2T3A180_9PEZI|nr:hypothetical protein BD289DRAFT_507819 [Coniella lustricola]